MVVSQFLRSSATLAIILSLACPAAVLAAGPNSSGSSEDLDESPLRREVKQKVKAFIEKNLFSDQSRKAKVVVAQDASGKMGVSVQDLTNYEGESVSFSHQLPASYGENDLNNLRTEFLRALQTPRGMFARLNQDVFPLILQYAGANGTLSLSAASKTLNTRVRENGHLWDSFFKDAVGLVGRSTIRSLQDIKEAKAFQYYQFTRMVQKSILCDNIINFEDLNKYLSQIFAASSPQGSYLRGLLHRAYAGEKQAFSFFMMVASQGDLDSQECIVQALYEGKLGQGRPETDRFIWLEKFEQRSYRGARELVNDAIYNGDLGQNERPQADRFNELKKREAMGDTDAQEYVNLAIYKGRLGQNQRPETDRFNELKKREAMGDTDAQRLVTVAIYNGNLGQNERPEADRFNELKKREAMGDTYAREYINAELEWALGSLGQRDRSQTERLNELKMRAAQGDRNAQEHVNHTIYKGRLGQNERPEADRFNELKERADQGDTNAQNFVNEAIYSGRLGQNIRARADRFNELKKREAMGDTCAQMHVTRCLHENYLQGDRKPNELLNRAVQGDLRAQGIITANMMPSFRERYIFLFDMLNKLAQNEVVQDRIKLSRELRTRARLFD